MNPQPPNARLRPFQPVEFGRYTLLLPLSTGGMGEIFLARMSGAQGFEKLCVIKKILPSLSSDGDFVERFVNEAKTLVKLNHGSIAQVLDMGQQDGDPYIALEFVDGKDLRKVAERMRRHEEKIPLTFTLYVMGRVLDALAYAHRKKDEDDKDIKLVHRDISPQNILISYEGEVKVIDFGLAKSTLNAAKTNPSIILGKFLYMSPEQARHLRVDRRSDLYSVGLCLYEMISGRNPYDTVSPSDLMSMVANPSLPALDVVAPDCPAKVSEVVMKALAVDPDDRYATAEEFRGKVLACLLELDASAGPEVVSKLMMESFGAEHHAERRMLQSFRSASDPGSEHDAPTAVLNVGSMMSSPTPPPVASPTMRMPPPPLPSTGRPVPVPLSFEPTPRASADNAPPSMFDPTVPQIDSPAPVDAGPSHPTLTGLPDFARARTQLVAKNFPPLDGLEVTDPSAMALPLRTVTDGPTMVNASPYQPTVPFPVNDTDPQHRAIPDVSNPVVSQLVHDDTLDEERPKARAYRPSRAKTQKDIVTDPLPRDTPRRAFRRHRSSWVMGLPLLLVLGLGAAYVTYELQHDSATDVSNIVSAPKDIPIRRTPVPPVKLPEAPADELDVAPLTAPSEKKPAVKHKTAPKANPALVREWRTAKATFKKLEQRSPCDNESMLAVCLRFHQLESELDVNPTGDEAMLIRVRDLHRILDRRLSAAP